MTAFSKFDFLQLDLLIRRAVALGPVHGHAIAQRIRALQIQQDSLHALQRFENKNFLAGAERLRG